MNHSPYSIQLMALSLNFLCRISGRCWISFGLCMKFSFIFHLWGDAEFVPSRYINSTRDMDSLQCLHSVVHGPYKIFFSVPDDFWDTFYRTCVRTFQVWSNLSYLSSRDIGAAQHYCHSKSLLFFNCSYYCYYFWKECFGSPSKPFEVYHSLTI